MRLSWDERMDFERTAEQELDLAHPEFRWGVVLLRYGLDVGVACYRHDGKTNGLSIIGPKDDYRDIADHLAEKFAGGANDKA